MHVQIHNPSEVNCSPPKVSFFECARHLIELHTGGSQTMFHGPCHGIGLGRCPGPPSLNSADATSDGSRGRTDAHSFVDAFDREIELVSIGSQPFIGRVRSAVEIMATDLAVISLTDLAAGLVGSVPDDIVTSGDTIFLAIGIRTRNIRELPFWSSFSHLIHRMGYGLLNISKYQIIMGTIP